MPGVQADHHLTAVFAHPDDEAFSVAGTLALAAAAGARISLVCATRGEAGSRRPATAAGDAQLAALRSEELARSCSLLGAEPPRWLDLRDGALATLAAGELEDRLRPHLDELAPDVIVTLGADGAYGHSDHVACTHAVVSLVGEIESRRRVRLLCAEFPVGMFDELRDRLGKARRARLDPGLARSALGIEREQADLVVEVSAVRETKLAALACHRSQIPSGNPADFLLPGLVDPLLVEEWFSLAAGVPLPAAATSPFDGL